MQSAGFVGCAHAQAIVHAQDMAEAPLTRRRPGLAQGLWTGLLEAWGSYTGPPPARPPSASQRSARAAARSPLVG